MFKTDKPRLAEDARLFRPPAPDLALGFFFFFFTAVSCLKVADVTVLPRGQLTVY